MKPTGKLWVLGLLSSSISLACHSAPITFDNAWNLLLENNYSLKAQRANVESYQYQQDATGNLNLPQVSIGANYTRLDTDVTLSAQQVLDSTGAHIAIPHFLTPPPRLQNVTFLLLLFVLFGLFSLVDASTQRKRPLKVKRTKQKVSSRWNNKRALRTCLNTTSQWYLLKKC
ncbi:hypothetical protein VA249_12140 [Vibrio alfacsensis]|nr:hypothetical protein VA249_12140 [Vibrio alfacsensis]